jgi:hypothetical protein
MGSNSEENLAMSIALNRKPGLFASYDEGAEPWACIASLLETVKLHAIGPYGYLSGTFGATAKGYSSSCIDEMLHRQFKRSPAESWGSLQYRLPFEGYSP